MKELTHDQFLLLAILGMQWLTTMILAYTVERAKRIENRLDRLTAQLEIQPGRPLGATSQRAEDEQKRDEAFGDILHGMFRRDARD
jgi:hypothetical protein